jgi:hypothetical protein
MHPGSDGRSFVLIRLHELLILTGFAPLARPKSDIPIEAGMAWSLRMQRASGLCFLDNERQ